MLQRISKTYCVQTLLLVEDGKRLEWERRKLNESAENREMMKPLGFARLLYSSRPRPLISLFIIIAIFHSTTLHFPATTPVFLLHSTLLFCCNGSSQDGWHGQFCIEEGDQEVRESDDEGWRQEEAQALQEGILLRLHLPRPQAGMHFKF